MRFCALFSWYFFLVLHIAVFVCVCVSHQYPAAAWPRGSLNATHCSGGPYSHCHLLSSLHMAGEWAWSNPLVASIIWQYLPASLSDWRPWTTPCRAPLKPDAEEGGRREKIKVKKSRPWQHFYCSQNIFFTVWAVEQLAFQLEEWHCEPHGTTLFYSLKSKSSDRTLQKNWNILFLLPSQRLNLEREASFSSIRRQVAETYSSYSVRADRTLTLWSFFFFTTTKEILTISLSGDETSSMRSFT